ncbi:fimbrillin family protein [Elizabethkingia meningoseptica]|uniref:fimbrillin family protein n=1 Tax=Elizabethkingia meningoseptica TaxID=238 RepID=UPI002012BE75|nr:fimbrillin family protein [Elizabethkingia meningoseptica]MCL1674707.1 fimbrillin family protein [Elizabethkingia meningoseptica]MCL1685925.1 fimbrillin family protein [Elizabethkingia meningoseptica]
MMKLQFRAAGLSLLALSFAFNSCRSSEGPIDGGNNNNGQFNVQVNLAGVETIEETPVLQASASTGKSGISATGVQQTVIPFDGKTTVTATLVPQVSTSVKSSAQASVNPMAAIVQPGPTELAIGTKYKVAVYDSNGNFLQEKEFTYQKNETDGFNLNGDQNYTFVAYSVNSTTSSPTINNGGTLANAKLSAINGDLMYFKKNVTVTGNGPNRLDVVLKHQYSQIKTTLDARQVGNISAVTSPAITPASSSADISFATDALTYNAPITGGQIVTFPTLNQQTVTSNPTQVIANTTTTGELNIGTVTIDGVSKNNMKISNLKITPGVKYNLNLRFGPCRQDINPVPFSVKDGVTQTFTMPATDFGFVFDIYTLDNSFNLTINGTKMATGEIQFEKGSSPAQNIRFADGTAWQDGTIGAIYNLKGTGNNPLVRVVISKDGSISMFGSKTSGGPLQPLQLFNGNSFNKITWNTTGTNTVVASQMVLGTTYMSGFGTGKQIVTCTP